MAQRVRCTKCGVMLFGEGMLQRHCRTKHKKSENDSQAEEKIKAWEKSFSVTKKLQDFAKDVKNQIDASDDGYITLVGYFAPISGLIEKLESD